jgi:hypothetical protein
MKMLKCVAVLLAFGGLMLVGCSDELQSPVAPTNQSIQSQTSLQKDIIRLFTGYEHPTSVISPGNVYVVDGKQIAKDVKYATHFEATFTDGNPDLLSGDGVLVLNQVLDLTTYEGFATGKLTVTPWNSAAGGIWEISWHSKVFLAPDPNNPAKLVLTYPGKWVGHGKGGTINGMQLSGDDIIKYNPLDPMDWRGDGGLNCYVKEHK